MSDQKPFDPTQQQSPGTPLGTDFITTPGGGSSRSEDERMKGMLSHLGIFVPILVPFLILQANGKQSPFIRAHATEALNFHITLLIPVLVSVVLTATVIGACVGIPMMLAAGIFGLVFGLIAAFKAKDGEAYRYPMTIRFMK